MAASDPARDTEPAIYSCPICPRTFKSSQALGGHQNAHRHERYNMKRRENELKMQRLQQRQRVLLPRPQSATNFTPLTFNIPPFGAYPAAPATMPYDCLNTAAARTPPVDVAGPSAAAEVTELDLTLRL